MSTPLRIIAQNSCSPLLDMLAEVASEPLASALFAALPHFLVQHDAADRTQPALEFTGFPSLLAHVSNRLFCNARSERQDQRALHRGDSNSHDHLHEFERHAEFRATSCVP
jgi:hypothetical protein